MQLQFKAQAFPEQQGALPGFYYFIVTVEFNNLKSYFIAQDDDFLKQTIDSDAGYGCHHFGLENKFSSKVEYANTLNNFFLSRSVCFLAKRCF